jgi:P27 family predicted phage terminase small subunit
MGTRGPVPFDEASRRLYGTRNKRDKRAIAARRPTEPPKMPRHLDKRAKAEWRAIVPGLTARGVLCELDGLALAMYCTMVSQLEHLTETLTREGVTYTGPRGGTHVRPEVRMARHARQEIAQMAAQFGLTPTSRARMRIPHERPEAQIDHFEEFLAGRSNDPLGPDDPRMALGRE